MDINDIQFGNPTIGQQIYLTTKYSTYLEKVFPYLTGFTFPRNDATATKDDLNDLIKFVKQLTEDEECQNRYAMYDHSLIGYFKSISLEKGQKTNDVTKLIDDIMKDSMPLVMKLKYYFNRPRPSQLAPYLKLKLFPFDSFSADAPSFPSGYAVYSKILCEVIGNTYPKKYKKMMLLCEDICNSRIYMGLNYQSDIDVGLFVADSILRDDEFKLRYKL